MTQIILESMCLVSATDNGRITDIITTNKNTELISSISNQLLFSSITIAPESSIELSIQKNNTIIIPIVGNLLISNIEILIGNAYTIPNSSNQLSIFNNQIELAFALIIQTNKNTSTPIHYLFDIINKKNEWEEIMPNIEIAKLDGRKELFDETSNGIYIIFCINGAMECNGCLLHQNDTLLIKNETLELEALSNETIVLKIKL